MLRLLQAWAITRCCFPSSRAVQIQNAKLQERGSHEGELQQLRVALGQCQEQVRTLEMNNYSLALHLQQATNGAGVEHRPPDVF